MTAPVQPAQDQPLEYFDDSPYCECDLEPTEEEMASMTCSCCGKQIPEL